MQATKLPPGPKLPSAIQMIGFWNRPLASMERARARYGKRFTIKLPATPPFVIHSEPDHIKEIFAAPPEVLHPGEGARLLEPIVGANSLILLDEGPHLSQRKLLLPALHGERLAGLSDLVRDVTEREVESWPTDEPVVTARPPPGPDARDHPPRRVRPRSGPAPRRAPHLCAASSSSA